MEDKSFQNKLKTAVNNRGNQVSPIFRKYAKLALVFLYLWVLLFWAMLQIQIVFDKRWVSKGFFSFRRVTTSVIQLSFSHSEAKGLTIVTLLAMLGYPRGFGSSTGVERLLSDRTVAVFKQSTSNPFKQFYWICMSPWIMYFSGSWLRNMETFLEACRTRDFAGAQNINTFLLMTMTYFLAQLLLASEVAYTAFQGYLAMKNYQATYKIQKTQSVPEE